MMEGNPYSAFAAAFAPREQGGFFVGTVTSAEPLQVDVGGISVSGGSLWVNEALGKLPELALKAGDQVVLLSEDDQVFYLLCKVVSG